MAKCGQANGIDGGVDPSARRHMVPTPQGINQQRRMSRMRWPVLGNSHVGCKEVILCPARKLESLYGHPAQVSIRSTA